MCFFVTAPNLYTDLNFLFSTLRKNVINKEIFFKNGGKE